MQIAAALGMVAFIGVCSLVGVRLLIRAIRGGGTPELCCALGFVWIGLLGYPASIASGQGVARIGEMSAIAWTIGAIFTNAGIGSFLVFTWRVFRPADRWAAWLTGVTCIALVAGFVGNAFAIAGAHAAESSFDVTYRWNVLLQLVSITCFAWTSVEAGIQYAMARRRQTLGFSDAMTVDRFAQWTIFGASTTLLSLVFAVVHWMGWPGATSTTVHVSSALLGWVSSAAIYLAFLPPARYVEWVEARATAG